MHYSFCANMFYLLLAISFIVLKKNPKTSLAWGLELGAALLKRVLNCDTNFCCRALFLQSVQDTAEVLQNTPKYSCDSSFPLQVIYCYLVLSLHGTEDVVL